jgi:hypothetical protein
MEIQIFEEGYIVISDHRVALYFLNPLNTLGWPWTVSDDVACVHNRINRWHIGEHRFKRWEVCMDIGNQADSVDIGSSHIECPPE